MKFKTYLTESKTLVPTLVRSVHDNFFQINVPYDTGPRGAVLSRGGQKTMSGQDRDTSSKQAMKVAQKLLKAFERDFNLEDKSIGDNNRGNVEIFMVSDEFAKQDKRKLLQKYMGPL